MTGFPSCSIASNSACPLSEYSLPETGVSLASSWISAPAAKAFSPEPVRITTRMSPSPFASSKAAPRSRIVAEFSALRTEGRLTVTYAMPSFFSKSKFSNIGSLIERLWICGIRVVVKSAACLLAVMARQNQALQQRGRRESLLAEFVEHDIGDVIGRLQTDEIQKGERSHWVAAAKL